MRFPFYKQPDTMDCGPTCLRMVAKYYGRSISLQKLRRLSEVTREGSSLDQISKASEAIGFRSLGVKVDLNMLLAEVPLPCIAFWEQKHFVVIYKVDKKHIWVADPAHGLVKLSHADFLEGWIGKNANSSTEEGILLLLEPTPCLNETEEDDTTKSTGFSFLFGYVLRYKKFIVQLIIGLIAGSVLQLIFPFLTQSIVDVGVQQRDISFVYLILFAQLLLFAGRISIDIIRGWILLHLSTRINISLISDFFVKLMNLPIAFFDSKMTGDILQRINDHQRIENLLTTTSLNVLFSLFNLFIFGGVLAWYSAQIFFIFLTGALLYLGWIFIFLKKRRELDHKRFSLLGNEQSKIIELINGMQEIKLHNAEREKRWSWEFLQARLFKIETKNLRLQQSQTVGSNFINELSNILITVVSAKLVIDGQITLGSMLAISYITGQLNSPIQQLVNFTYTLQDAKIALERLSEIHSKEEEEPNLEDKEVFINEDADLILEGVSFRYPGASENVLSNINLTIPHGKTTAIVGSSGSGKTTLMKLLLKFYQPTEGNLKLGTSYLENISQEVWRNHCGVVLQEGYIFNDTIAKNIAIGHESIDRKKLVQAVKTANIQEYIEELPLGYNTKVGQEGIGMSTGQKQRLLIARAVYKNPSLICFDEATSALDAKNERIIIENLNGFFKNRTAIIVAHRLSTVKNADQIVVVEHGKIIEIGTHEELVESRGSYFNLVKNQLQLESLNAKK